MVGGKPYEEYWCVKPARTLQPSAFSTALQSNWCNCPFLQTHRVGDRPPQPHVRPPTLKMKPDFNMKVSFAHDQAEWGPRIGHSWMAVIQWFFTFFFHADVPGLPFFPYYKFSIYCRRWGAEIIRFQPSVSARIHACSCAAVTNVNPVPYKGEQV